MRASGGHCVAEGSQQVLFGIQIGASDGQTKRRGSQQSGQEGMGFIQVAPIGQHSNMVPFTVEIRTPQCTSTAEQLRSQQEVGEDADGRWEFEGREEGKTEGEGDEDADEEGEGDEDADKEAEGAGERTAEEQSVELVGQRYTRGSQQSGQTGMGT